MRYESSITLSGFHVMARQASGFVWVVILGLALTMTISILLLYSACAQRRLSGTFYHTIVTNRAVVQIIVQIISQLLGIIHIFVLTRLFDVFTVQRFQSVQSPLTT